MFGGECLLTDAGVEVSDQGFSVGGGEALAQRSWGRWMVGGWRLFAGGVEGRRAYLGAAGGQRAG
jgi:hypothetical protein